MRITKTFCDLCEKECHQQRFGVVSGCIMKMDDKGQMNNMVFEGHYCEDDIGKILEFIEKNAKHTNTAGVVESVEQGTANSGT